MVAGHAEEYTSPAPAAFGQPSQILSGSANTRSSFLNDNSETVTGLHTFGSIPNIQETPRQEGAGRLTLMIGAWIMMSWARLSGWLQS